jgi:hypothetical protein
VQFVSDKRKKKTFARLFECVVAVFKMIEGYGAVTQALLGTLLTWGLTAAGAGLVVFLRGNHVRYCEVFLGILFIRKSFQIIYTNNF